MLFRSENGYVLNVLGADMLDGTPIYDIKPYLAFTDSHPDAIGGFSDGVFSKKLDTNIPKELLSLVDAADRETLISMLADDPRPSYIEDAERVYGMKFANYEIFFKVENNTLSVVDIKCL